MRCVPRHCMSRGGQVGEHHRCPLKKGGPNARPESTDHTVRSETRKAVFLEATAEVQVQTDR